MLERTAELLDTVITSMFQAGLSLQAAMDLPGDIARESIEHVLEHLDDTIREIRGCVLTAPQASGPSQAAGP
jgi:hypothetical protein